MSRLKYSTWGLCLLLVLAIMIAPVLPAFGMALAKSDAVSAAHDGPAHDKSQHATDADTLPDCTQHHDCHSQCCAFCAQCFTAVFFVLPDYVVSHPVQTPVLSQLHSLVLITSPDRPPRFLFL
jgi:hypothetical protein